MTLEEKLKALQSKLAEKSLLEKIKKCEWPFTVDPSDVDQDIVDNIIELLHETLDSRIAELEDEKDPATKVKTNKKPTKEEIEQVEAAYAILAKYGKSLPHTENRGDTDQLQGNSVLNKQPVLQQPKEHRLSSKVAPGSIVTLLDINTLESIHPSHKNEFLPDDKVRIMKIYEHKGTGLVVADIVKDSPSKGKVRATVSINDLE